jgi:TM2 domain-containing membrane protein YozV
MSEPVQKTPLEKFCHACGAVIRTAAEICPKCGVRQLTASSLRNRVTAALFALLLGGLGVHKFYLGKVGQGFLYLLFCWTFVPAVIAFIEGIIYLTLSDQAFQERYGTA